MSDTRLATPLSPDEAALAVRIGDRTPTPSLGSLLALEPADAVLAAARDQLAMAVLERVAPRAPGSLRELDGYLRADPSRITAKPPVDAALARQGLSLNSSLICEPERRLRSATILADTAAGQAARHYRAFGVEGPTLVEHHRQPRLRGTHRVRGDFRRTARNDEALIDDMVAFVASRDAQLASRIVGTEATGFDWSIYLESREDAVALRDQIDAFARARFVIPPAVAGRMTDW